MSLNPVPEAEDSPDATNIRVSMLKSEKEMEVRLFPVETSDLASDPPYLVLRSAEQQQGLSQSMPPH